MTNLDLWAIAPWTVQELGAAPNDPTFVLHIGRHTFREAHAEMIEWVIWREQRGWVAQHGHTSPTGHPAVRLTNEADGRRQDGTYADGCPRVITVQIVGPAAEPARLLAA